MASSLSTNKRVYTVAVNSQKELKKELRKTKKKSKPQKSSTPQIIDNMSRVRILFQYRNTELPSYKKKRKKKWLVTFCCRNGVTARHPPPQAPAARAVVRAVIVRRAQAQVHPVAEPQRSVLLGVHHEPSASRRAYREAVGEGQRGMGRQKKHAYMGGHRRALYTIEVQCHAFLPCEGGDLLRASILLVSQKPNFQGKQKMVRIHNGKSKTEFWRKTKNTTVLIIVSQKMNFGGKQKKLFIIGVS